LPPNVENAQKLGLSLTEDGFITEKDPQLNVNETTVPGIFVAGAVQQPMHSYEAVTNASSAAQKAIAALEKNRSL
jgi:heterodisulfide reductase subunit A-like polyferredoxin